MSDDPTVPTDGAEPAPADPSRRSFLRQGAAGALGAAILGDAVLGAKSATAEPAAPATAQALAVVGPGPVPVTLTVNGKPLAVTVEPRVTLLDALRDRLDITGAKKVCDRGTCGACTVLLDGHPVYSCSVLAVEAQGRAIATVEGLASVDETGAGALHPLQAAFVAHDALQCGYCTPGFVMAAAGLLARNPNPTREDVEHGLGGNLCRCGTYAGIRDAVLDAAKVMRAPSAPTPVDSRRH